MKHLSNREFFARWDAARDGAPAPDRNAIAPESVRRLLGDIFVLSYDPSAGHPFRVAGTRMCARLGKDLKGESFVALFAGPARHEIEDIIGIVADESLPTVAGVTATTSEGETAHFELLLLPFASRAHAPISLTGQFASFTEMPGRLSDLTLTSWRHIQPDQPAFGPRMLRKLELARGLMVYEGLH